ncbi:MAG TPA: GntR family transcriptional regulator [Burkholderiaceae bacterium]|nr:GntR family transcriptional regulator [Burkholderiaceae bacterium]
MNPRYADDALLPTLPLQIAERIGARILDERFSPGERLKEVELASGFGVSRATVREALRVLEQRGLVRISPQRGAQVTQLSPKELENLFDVRAMILGLGSRRAAERCGEADRRELLGRLDALAAVRGDRDAYVRESSALVARLMRLSDNDAVVSYVEEFAFRIGRYVRLGLATDADREQSLAIWTLLVRAVVAGDGARAESLHRELALRNRDAALAAVERRAGAAGAMADGTGAAKTAAAKTAGAKTPGAKTAVTKAAGPERLRRAPTRGD